MRFTSLRGISLGAVTLATLTVGIAGCSHSKSSAAVDNRRDAVQSIQTMRTDLTQADSQIQATQASLHDLVNQQSGDLTPTYNTFSSNVDKTAAMSDKLHSRTNSVTNTSYAYVNDWNYNSNLIRDDQLRQDSIARQQQARKNYDQALSQMNDQQAAYANYVHTLQDIRAYAAANLSPGGIQQLKGQISKADNAAQNLRQKMVNVDGNLNQLATSWQTSIPVSPEQQRQNQAVPAGGRMEPGMSDPGYRDQRGNQMTTPAPMNSSTQPTMP
jgi:chromosome segregation ATPase